LSSIANKDYSDIDIFFENSSDCIDFMKILNKEVSNLTIFSTQNAYTINKENDNSLPPIQLIKQSYSVKRTLRNFDFINCMAAIKENDFYFDSNFHNLINNKVLDFNFINIKERVSKQDPKLMYTLIKRIHKYVKRYDLELSEKSKNYLIKFERCNQELLSSTITKTCCNSSGIELEESINLNDLWNSNIKPLIN